MSLAKTHFGSVEIVSNKLKRLSLDFCNASGENFANVMLGSKSLETLSLYYASISPSIHCAGHYPQQGLLESHLPEVTSTVGWTIQSLQALCECTGLMDVLVKMEEKIQDLKVAINVEESKNSILNIEQDESKVICPR